ncbi:serine/threonine protein kinase [Aggregicoccus sp. 17bor-14]|uniref:serine/threonine-protein kinase n=1 Tax=Myxococcaceae TaxID=31 RepID=UPI00129C8B48|nr:MULTISPECIES: serine/threonine-protein kinase [Myxococcaceae]MBF5044955.1 serine/threonine protein kinase [Simulacricoccus sp. 17bor-14]MRI90698.1 serine/threonine protein kinase [Aggregicoccus sp. 17bor-14]
MPPKVIGPYRVLDTLGAGGAGTVYRAVDRRNNEAVALKLLSAGPALDPRAARRLAREFETLADLAHPNVVKVFDTGVYQGYPYLAMELIEGLTLRHYLSLRGEDLLSPSASGSGSGSHHVPRWQEGPRLDLRALRDPEAFASDDSDELSLSEDVSHDGTFGLAAFGEESPSEEVSGPESLRAFARAMEEPDTRGDSGAFVLPPDVSLVGADAAAHAGRAGGADLQELNRPERVGRLKDSMLQLCEALAYIHQRGLVHRDLKPSNIMVDEDRQVRLMDFGLAKFLADDAQVTADGRLVGTFRYMAPEQILGEQLDARADLYSLGVILYELLSGQPPFDAKTPYELWQKVLETEPVPLLALNLRGDVQLARVAHRLMRKEPDDRYQTAEEVLEALSE